jgi:hypothetical protein
MGSVLQFSGTRRLQQELAATVSRRLHGTRLQVSASGNTRLVPTNVQGPPSPQQAALSASFAGAINENATVGIALTASSKSVLFGSYNLQTIDMADVRALGTGNPFSAAGTIAHEVTEQTLKQVQGVTDYDYKAAHTVALQTSNARPAGSAGG